MKDLIKRYEEALRESEELDTMIENDPENEELENLFDKAYEKEYNLYIELTNEIVKVTSGKIDTDTAKAMIKTRFADLKNLIEMVA